jgi:anti-sigma regulatory factor (Ser/Thr protein kinase)
LSLNGAVVERRLHAGPRAPEEARGLVRNLPVDSATRANLELIVSELVANSVVHGGAGVDGAVTLRLRSETEAVSGEICDGGAGFDWEPHEPELSEPGGLGLLLVDRLSESWGVSRNCAACVWFVCATEAAGTCA